MTREDRMHFVLLVIALAWIVWATVQAFHYRRPREVPPEDIRNVYRVTRSA